MAVVVKIGGVDKTDSIKPGTLKCTRTYGEPWTCEFGTFDQEGVYYPDAGETISVEIDGSVYFGGVVRSVDRIKEGSFTDVLETACSATDWNVRFEKRSAGQYEWIDETAGAIIASVNTNSLSGEGFDTSLVETGPTISNFRTDYGDMVSDVWKRLLELCPGYRLFVDPDKKIRFYSAAASPPTDAASFDIPVSAGNISSLKVRETDEGYFNYVIGRVGRALRDPQPETFTGDGTTTSFELAFPCAIAPTITINGVPNSVGIASIDTGRDWYWSEGSTEIRQDAGGTPLSASDTLVVEYVGIESIIVLSKDDAEIAARQAVEGGSGQYHKVIDIEGMLSRGDAQAICDGYLYDHIDISLIANYETSDWIESQARNLTPGSVQSIMQDGWGAQQPRYFVRSIVATLHEHAVSTHDNGFVYEVEAIHGSLTKTLFQWFKDLQSGGRGSGVAGNQDVEQIHFMSGCDEITAGSDIAPHRPVLHRPGSIQYLTSDFKTAPTVDTVYNILRSKDAGASWASIFATGSATHPAGLNGPISVTGFGDGAKALPRLTKFKLDVLSGSGGQGWAIKLSSRPITGDAGALLGDGSDATGIAGTSSGTSIINTIL